MHRYNGLGFFPMHIGMEIMSYPKKLERNVGTRACKSTILLTPGLEQTSQSGESKKPIYYQLFV